MTLECFKAYDIRGRVPDQLNEDIVYAIGRAYAEFLKPEKVVVGHDIRLSSPGLCDRLVQGLIDSGVDVLHIGQCGTEEIYFATEYYKMDGGIVVTASHNPKDYNGMKLVREESKPISGDTGLDEIRLLAEKNEFASPARQGTVTSLDHRSAYLDKLMTYVDTDSLQPLKIVANAGNGAAGPVLDGLDERLPFEFVKLHHEADGNFPHGVPNPLLVENRMPTIEAIRDEHADLGIAWDGDFDRCFFFDENGRFIEGYYIVGLLAEAFLQSSKGGRIVHDPRLTWNTVDIVESNGGEAIMSKTGHAFIKERMRLEQAVYGGEMSAMLMSQKGKSLSQLVDERMQMFPASGEINRRVEDAGQVLQTIEQTYAGRANEVDHTDGLSMVFDNWRFNVRMSNTEPVVRLNVESRADATLMAAMTDEVLELLGGEPA
jgi:phosphomannomutase